MASPTVRIAILANAAQARSELESVAESTTTMADRVKATMPAVGAALGAALAVGIAGALERGDVAAKLQAQLGVGEATAARAGEIAGNVYERGFGENLADVGGAVKAVMQQIGDTSTAQGGLEGVTQRALALSTVFEQDVSGTAAAAGQMIKTGLARNADEAMDILAKGFQNGANKADDLVDTFNEYGTQFRKVGIDGKMALGLISQGLQAGARDADIVADAIKEFSIRAIDGSKTTADGFKSLGLSGKKMQADIAAGGPKATAALDLTLDRLRGIKDPAKRSAAAVALFGTQAEDLGDALYKLDPSEAVKGLGQVGGAAQRAVDAIGSSPMQQIEVFKRKVLGGLTEVGGAIAGFAMSNSTWLVPVVGVLAGIAATIWLVNAATVAWTAVQAASAAVTGAWTAAQTALNASFLANPITWVIIGIVALVAIIVVAWKKSEAFRTVVLAVWSGIKTAVAAVVSWFSANIPRIWQKAASVFGSVKTAGQNAFNGIRDKAREIITAVVSWISGIPGKVTGFFGDAGSLLAGAGRRIIQGLWDGLKERWEAVKAWFARVTSAIPSLKGPASRDSRLLLGAGRLVMGGFLTGLESQYGAVQSSLGGFTDSLSGAAQVGGTLTLDPQAAPGWAQRLERLLEAGLTVRLESSGNRGDDALLDLIRERVTVKGGRAATLGIRS